MSDPTDPTPERPGMSERTDANREESAGQRSEVGRLDPDDAGTPISPSDATAGYPDSESGAPDTRGAGPNAAPPDNVRDNDFKPRHRKPDAVVDDL
jgi:hypothetical protein